MEYYEKNIWEDQINGKQFSRNLTIGNTKITGKSLIGKYLKNFFVNRGSKLATAVSNKIKTFQTFLPEINAVLNGANLTDKEFLDAFQSLEMIKLQALSTNMWI